jgi:hypothetical protein
LTPRPVEDARQPAAAPIGGSAQDNAVVAALAAHQGAPVQVLSLAAHRPPRWYQLAEVHAAGVLLIDAHAQRLFLAYADLAARTYRCVGSAAARAIMEAAAAWASRLS